MHQFQLSVSLLVFLLLRFSTRTPATGAPDRIDLKFCGTDEAPDGRVLTWVDLLLQRSFKEFPSVQCSAFGWISFCFKSLGQHTRTLLRAEGSLHLNRSRALAQLGHQAEAAQDLSIVISLWAAHAAAGSPRIGKDEECKEQLVKAFYLRAKTRMSRQRIEPARSDLAAAAALRPAEATAKLLRQAERELEAVQKEKVRSNKKLAKEIAKFADSAMSGLSEAELAALGAGTE
eukprot:s828_g13.t1